MSQLVYTFNVTIPAGTSIASKWSQQINFPEAVVNEIDVRVPPGCRGNVGFSLGSSGTAVIPYNSGQWVVTDDEKISWAVSDQFNSGSWQFFGYNNGTFPHTIYVRFQCDPVTPAQANLDSLDLTSLTGG